MDAEKAAKFCEDLYGKACEQAHSRLGTLPKKEQLQMADLLHAFNTLKLDSYAHMFKEIHGQWNDALALVNTYTKAVETHIFPEMALSIAHAIQKWHQYKSIPQDLQASIEKAVHKYAHNIEVYAEKLNRFFDQLHLHASSLQENSSEELTGFIKEQRLLATETYHKGLIQQVEDQLQNMVEQLQEKVEQHPSASRDFVQLAQKARQSLPKL